MKTIRPLRPSVLAVPAVLAVLSLQACQPAQPATAIATYKVEGMTCDACAANIETSVGKIKGVLSVEASYKDGRAVVTYAVEKVEPAAIEAAVDGMGYPAALAAVATPARQGS